MANVLFISETFLKQNTQVSDNVDVKYIRESILWAQDTEIQPVLGTTLYNKLKTDIAASSLARKHECRPIGQRPLLDALILYGFPRINDGQAGRFKGRCVA